MRAPPLLLLLLPLLANCQSCRSDGKYCSTVLSASVLSRSTLDYKCSFPIYIAMSDILKLDPTVYITMKIGEYCPKSCCSIVQTTTSTTRSTTPSTTSSTTPSTTSSTTPSTSSTTTTPEPTTTVYRTLLDKFNDVMNADGAFKSLMDEINFSSSASEGMQRYRVYSTTKKQVDEHNVMFNLGMSSFQMATNAFSVALAGEVAPLTLSLDALKPTTTVAPARKKRDASTVAATVDWRPYMKPILNQLTCGGCWAFSMVAMVEGFFAIQGFNTTSLSVQQLLTCDTLKDATYGVANVGCKGGYFQVAGSYLEVTAERDATDIPFDMEDTDCDSTSFPPVVPTILLFDDGFVSGNLSASQLITMEQNIEDKVRKGPVSVGMAVSQDIYSYSSGIYDGSCGPTINHAVVIVGFTDEYWIIRNSWGSAWGEDGYMRVKRTSGQDPCKLYSYWSQATAIGSNETYVPPKVGGGEYVVPKTSTEGSTVSSENSVDDCGEVPCEEQCGCDYDDDDDEDEDYEEEDEEEYAEEEEVSETSLTTASTSSTTSSTSTMTSTTSSSTSTSTSTSTKPTTSTSPYKTTKTTTKPTTTTFRRTTTPRQSLYDKWVDGWNNFWGR